MLCSQQVLNFLDMGTLVNQHFSDLRITFEYMGIKWESGKLQDHGNVFYGVKPGDDKDTLSLWFYLLGYYWKLN